MKPNALAALALVASAVWAIPCAADWTDARCEVYPKGSDRMEKVLPCTFAQSQGHITITRRDRVTHDLMPVGDSPGNFHDQDGRPVYRQSGLGSEGRSTGSRTSASFSTGTPHPAPLGEGQPHSALRDQVRWREP